jgi:hypothetical protein
VGPLEVAAMPAMPAFRPIHCPVHVAAPPVGGLARRGFRARRLCEPEAVEAAVVADLGLEEVAPPVAPAAPEVLEEVAAVATGRCPGPGLAAREAAMPAAPPIPGLEEAAAPVAARGGSARPAVAAAVAVVVAIQETLETLETPEAPERRLPSTLCRLVPGLLTR